VRGKDRNLKIPSFTKRNIGQDKKGSGAYQLKANC